MQPVAWNEHAADAVAADLVGNLPRERDARSCFNPQKHDSPSDYSYITLFICCVKAFCNSAEGDIEPVAIGGANCSNRRLSILLIKILDGTDFTEAMMTHDPSLALAADYSDALITARRAKNFLVLLVLLMLLGQLALFFTAKYSNYIPVENPPAPMGGAATMPDPALLTSSPLPAKATEVMQYLVGVTGFLGITLSIVLALVVLLLTMIMLVGRLVGVSRVVSAFIWCIVLIVLLFPWQAFLADAHFASDFKIPGVLYTWVELVKFAKIDVNGNDPGLWARILHWGRFVAFPLLTIIITFMIQVKSNRGLREALGEVDAIAAAPIV